MTNDVTPLPTRQESAFVAFSGTSGTRLRACAQTTIATHGGAQRRPIRMQRRCLLGLLAVLALSLLLLLATAAGSQQVVHSTPAPSEFELPNREPLPTPAEQVRAICSLPEFQARTNLNATVVVFAWRRLESLRRLTQSLERAVYCGTEVPLLVLADAGASAEVLAYVSGLQWSHGAKRLYVHKGSALGIRGMWIHMFRQAEGRNLLPFEDDIEVSPLYAYPNPEPNPNPNPNPEPEPNPNQVSPLYYWWLARMVRQYGPLETAEQVRAKSLAGISLYTPRLNEIQYPQVKWVASKETRSPAFLLQVPCSWGALFFSAYFEEFLRFFDARTAPPFYNFTEELHQTGLGTERQRLGDWRVRLPNARCNVWPRSWKRFLIDFMFARGLVTGCLV